MAKSGQPFTLPKSNGFAFQALQCAGCGYPMMHSPSAFSTDRKRAVFCVKPPCPQYQVKFKAPFSEFVMEREDG